MTKSSAREKIRQFLADDLGIDLAGINDDSPLFTSGIVDSYALLELMSFLEAELQAKVDITDLSIEQLDTINALSSLC